MTMTHNTPFRGWIATLSNGNTVFEEPAVPGEPSSWQQFLHALKGSGVSITMLRLQRGGKTVHALPPKRCEGYFQAYEFLKSMFRDTEDHRQGIGSIIGNQVYIAWLDDSGNIWIDIRPLEEVKIHTTLRD